MTRTPGARFAREREGAVGSNAGTSAGFGRTIEPRIHISRRGGGSARCSGSRARVQPRNFFPHAAVYNTFNVQRHLISAQTHRALRGVAMTTWRTAVAAALTIPEVPTLRARCTAT